MNTATQSQPPAAGEAANFEDSIFDYLRSQAERLATQTGTHYTSVAINITRTGVGAFEKTVTAYIDEGTHLNADTVAQAVDRQLKEFIPIRAKILRDKADELLKQAAELEAKNPLCVGPS